MLWGSRERLPDRSWKGRRLPQLPLPRYVRFQVPGSPSSQSPLSLPLVILTSHLPPTLLRVPMLAPPPPENDTIYWVDMGLSTISRAKRDQTWREDVVTNGIGRVEGIAVDWIAGELRKG